MSKKYMSGTVVISKYHTYVADNFTVIEETEYINGKEYTCIQCKSCKKIMYVEKPADMSTLCLPKEHLCLTNPLFEGSSQRASKTANRRIYPSGDK